MQRPRNKYLLALSFGALFISACKKETSEKQESLQITAPTPNIQEPSGPDIPASRLAIFQPPLPKEFNSNVHPITEEKVELGRMLYFDARLSKNHDISCNTCHALDNYGVDNKPVSDGHRGQKGERNSPTVYNSAGHFVQFWDGRSPDVEHQATQPILNPVEMAVTGDKHAAEVLMSIPEYINAFKKAFPDDKHPVTLLNAGKAIGAFERRLVTPSRWDKFLEGDSSALTHQEKKGLLAFMDNGCTACHMGTLLGGTTYQKLGAVKPWPNLKDRGRASVTESETDEFLFKTPSLRNIEKTGPYFHDGSVESLEEAVRLMGEHQLGRDIPAQEVKDIVAWLKSLTGELPTEYIQPPSLPPSTDKTPQADPT